MLRGGSWNNDPQNLRSAQRNNNRPGNRNNKWIGFSKAIHLRVEQTVIIFRRAFTVLPIPSQTRRPKPQQLRSALIQELKIVNLFMRFVTITVATIWCMVTR